MIDCGNTYNLSDAGDLAAAYLHSCGRDRIDLLVLTHLHEDHADGVPAADGNVRYRNADNA